jgi:hydrogenase/urease accessory protein HupE
MNTRHMKLLIVMAGMILYIPSAFSHTSGEHSGGFVKQIMHIIQSADHLFIILALAVVVSLLIRYVKNKQGQ